MMTEIQFQFTVLYVRRSQMSEGFIDMCIQYSTVQYDTVDLDADFLSLSLSMCVSELYLWMEML